MAHSIVKWANTPDTWSVASQDLTSITIKYLVESNGLYYKLLDGVWTEVTGGLTVENFTNQGMDDITGITAQEWQLLSDIVKIHVWTDDIEVTGANINYGKTYYVSPEIELTVPEYRLIDQLERPLSIMTYTDGETVPVLKQQYSMQNVGTRIMKRG